MNGSLNGWMLWTPRVLGLLMCAYLALFALDAFEPGKGVLRSQPGFGMHLLPAVVLLLVGLACLQSWLRHDELHRAT